MKHFNLFHYSFLIITGLFFLWGAFTCLNTFIGPQVEQLFMNNGNAFMRFSTLFFGLYFILALPAAYFTNKQGYKKGMSYGLILFSIGSLLFAFAAEYVSFSLFYTGIFILATGITLLQVSANTYILFIGKQKYAVNRLSIAQAINSLGYVLVLFLLLFNESTSNESIILRAQNIKAQFLVLGIILLILFFLFLIAEIPDIQLSHNQHKSEGEKYKSIIPGFIAMLFYVGAEIEIIYLLHESISGAQFEQHYLIYALIIYWGGLGVGRLLGYYLFKNNNAMKLLSINAFIFLALLSLMFFFKLQSVFWLLAVSGLLNSIMFPVIFSNSLTHYKYNKNIGAGILVMAFAGGAIIPLLIDILNVGHNFNLAIGVLFVSYLIILVYAGKPFTKKVDKRHIS